MASCSDGVVALAVLAAPGITSAQPQQAAAPSTIALDRPDDGDRGGRLRSVSDLREKLLRDFATSSKQNGYWVAQLSLRYQAGEPIDSLFELPERYKKITAKTIQDAAKLYLDPANHVKVTLFPEALRDRQW